MRWLNAPIEEDDAFERLWEEHTLSDVDESSDSDTESDSEATEDGAIPVPDSVRHTEGSEGDVDEFNMLTTDMDAAIERAVALPEYVLLIAIKNDLIGTHRPELDTNCEIIWVTIKIQGSKDITIGAFYRSPQFGNTNGYMNELRESINKIKRSDNEQIWLAGDFNLPDIDWDILSTKPGGAAPGLSKQLIEITNDFGLEQVVRGPTRINNTLDLFFTTNPTLVERSTVVPGISDHDGIPVIINSCKPRVIKQKPRKIYMYHKANVQALKEELLKWNNEFTSRDTSMNTVNEMYTEFQTILESIMNSHIPTKIISKRNQTPWINRRIKRLHKRKQRAFNTHKQQKNQASYEIFRKARKTTHEETRTAHRRYISSICSDSPKRFWSYIKSLKIDTIGIPTLTKDNRLESDNKLKAEILNNQFKSVFTSENTNLPQEPNTNIPAMPDIIITTEGVAKLLHGLNPNKATGPDEVPAKILQLAANELAPALSLIFQKSLTTGELPLSWLRANITPIFKKGDRSLASNYRPISLTSICCKILEHIIFSNIMNHFDQYAILTDRQHGFRRKHSTESQLILTTHDLANSLNNKSQTDMIIMDFSKAFDTVPHNRLLNKLNRYGIHNNTHTWISNFLKRRKQRVVVGGEHSTWTNVVSGVPQGTVLGPLLFLTYINDLPDNIHSTVRLFADDCVLYREIKNESDSHELQKDLNRLAQWEHDWQMHFNTQKCFVMRITHARHVKHYSYTLGDSTLQETDSHPYLGVCITKDLTWNKHIHRITASANRTLAFIRRNLHSCPQNIKTTAYTTLVRPLLEYSSSVWDPHTQVLINKIEMVQRRAARFCHNNYTSRETGCVSEMIKKLHIELLTTRRINRRLTIFHKAIHSHLSLPVANLLQPTKRHSRHLNSKAFNTIHASKNCYKFSFFPRTIKDWNSLPDAIVNITEPQQFKQALTHLAPNKHD